MSSTSLQQRSVYRDLLRIVSAAAVVCIHVVADALISDVPFSPSWMALNIYDTLVRFSVPVFFMISGSFFLDRKKEQPIKKLYTKNIFRLFVAFVCWAAIYGLIELIKAKMLSTPVEPVRFVLDTVKGEPHMWYIPAMIFLYAITPLLRKLCESKSLEKYFLLLCMLPLAYNLFNRFLTVPAFEYLVNSASIQFISGYTVYYVLGHYVAEYDIKKKHRVLIYLLAALSLIFTVSAAAYFKISGKQFELLYEYLLLNIFFPSLAVFLLFKQTIPKIKFKERTVKRITKLSSLSFGIYLSHMAVIAALKFLSVTAASFNPIFCAPIMTAVVFAVSLIITSVLSKIPVVNKYLI